MGCVTPSTGGDVASTVLLCWKLPKQAFKKKGHPAESSSQLIFNPVPHRLSQPVSLPVETRGRGRGFLVSFSISYFPLWMSTISATAPLVSPASLTVISNQSLEKKSEGLSSGSIPLHLPYSLALSTVLPF